MSSVAQKKELYYGWLVLGAGFFILFLATGSSVGFGVFVLPMSEEFGWSRGTISAAIATGWLVNGVTQPFIGRLFDRYGARKVISISLLVMGASTILLSQTTSIWFLIFVSGLVMAVARGGASLVTVASLLAKWFYRKRGIVLSLATAGGSAGSLLLVPFTAYMIILADWRVAWFVLGVMVLVLGLPLALFFMKEEPADVGQFPDGDPAPIGPKRSGRANAGRRAPLEADDWRDSYRSSPIRQMTAAYFVCGVTTAIISAHYIPFAIERGSCGGAAAIAFGLMAGLNVMGVIIVGAVSDKVSRKYMLGGVYAVRGLAYAMLVLAPGLLGIWGFAVIAGLSWVATAPLTASLTADIYGLRNLGTLNGASTFAHQIGGALSIYMGGVLYDLTGAYDLPFGIAGALLAGASLAAFSIREKTYSIRYQQTPEGAVAPAAGGD